MELRPGDRIGDYEVECSLGAGGMGQVYKVRNVISGRTEAMKVALSSEIEAELANCLVREIRVQAALTHPNITGVHTAQSFQGRIVMILEYVEGETLEEVFRRGALPVSVAVNYAIQALDALDYAHTRHVVHRDVKPANIMVTPEGVIKLMDFGVAKSPDIPCSERAVGSLSYMSPEQIRGARDVDARSDLYQVGLWLYECLTSARPTSGDNDYASVLARMESALIPAAMLNPVVPAELSRVIAKAIERNPADRYQSAAAFKTALLSALLRAATLPAEGVRPRLSRIAWLNYAALGFTTSVVTFASLAAAIWTFFNSLTT